MSDDDESLPATGLVLGIVFGVGLASVTAVLLDQSIATTAGYGAGAGLVVGSLTGRLADANRGQEQWGTRVVGGGAVLGLVLGVVVGALVAWAQAAPLTSGMVVGGPAGLVHGVLVGGLLAANERAKE